MNFIKNSKCDSYYITSIKHVLTKKKEKRKKKIPYFKTFGRFVCFSVLKVIFQRPIQGQKVTR